MSSALMDWLNLEPSAQSVDYVRNKQPFHLHDLLTEQRHPVTWNLSSVIRENTSAGLGMLHAVDRDIARKLESLVEDPRLPALAAEAVADGIREGRKIYFYGCGATGRLAKQMESTFWRPFWRRVRAGPLWKTLAGRIPDNIESLLIGEMTGGDRALVSSLEGFEDLQLIGRLQLEDHGVAPGDVVFCVTEGGETSSVIGAILAAARQCAALGRDDLAAGRLYFVYNNPDGVLRPLARSAAVLDHPLITRINLTTGPQAITGSTRMQATTIETYVLGVILEEAVARLLAPLLNPDEMAALGFGPQRTIGDRLLDFKEVQGAVASAAERLAILTELEAATYRDGHRTTYLAARALITVFIDSTERSPTFRLYPLDRVDEVARHSWVQVWTRGSNAREAWHHFLGRPFKGLDPARYHPAFESEVDDPYLRSAALRSLTNAGDDQESSYDFSFSRSNVQERGPSRDDLGILVLVDGELPGVDDPDSLFGGFLEMFRSRGAKAAVLWVGGPESAPEVEAARQILHGDGVFIPLILPPGDDPLTLRRQVALKMLLNAHSTGLMALLGRVIGNTMTSVSPSNLKLIGRATHLILLHVNDVLGGAHWRRNHGESEPVAYWEANAVLIDAMDYVREHEIGQTAEVALSIIRIVETCRRRGYVGWEEARRILSVEGLESFLDRHNPAFGPVNPR